jgi:hypothetical protein
MASKKPVDLSPETIKDTAMEALYSVASDGLAPSAARAAAARTMLEVIGAIGRNQDLSRGLGDPNPAEMTTGEISDEILRLSKKLPKPRIKKVI